MMGLRIPSKNKYGKYKIDFDFNSLVKCVEGEIGDLSWVLAETNFNSSVKDGSSFEPSEAEWSNIFPYDNGWVKVAGKRFLIDYSKFLVSDNNIIIGFPSLEDALRAAKAFDGQAASGYVILFECTDACFWEVFSPSESILGKIRMAFPNSEAVPNSD